MSKDILEESYGTLSETINGLIKLGYDHDFNVKEECLICHQIDKVLSPSDFQIDKVYRFEGASDPDDNSILYAISSIHTNSIKGTLVNGYGISSSAETYKVIEGLRTNEEHISQPDKSSDTIN